jgi:hypothetical protein
MPKLARGPYQNSLSSMRIGLCITLFPIHTGVLYLNQFQTRDARRRVLHRCLGVPGIFLHFLINEIL